MNQTKDRNEFWRGKRVLVTGHSGFKGGWLSLWLGAMEARVTGYALEPPSEPHFFGSARIDESVRSIIGNILDSQRLAEALSDCEIVFHLAAQPIVRLSYEDPVSTYMTNVMGTVGVLEAVRASPHVRAVVVVTSDKCYENPEWHWGCREVDAMGGHDPYSSSKGCTELVVSAYRRSYFTAAEPGNAQVALASARAGNVIGGGDWALDRLIPDVVRAVIAGRSASIRNPSAVRPWQHVLESLSGYLLLAERLYQGDARFRGGWNFGPRDEDAVSVSRVLDILGGYLGARAQWHVEADQHAPHEARFLHLDITKARMGLGWQPRWPLEEGLKATADWYLAFMRGADMREVSLRQIDAFVGAGRDRLSAPVSAVGA